MKSPNWIQKAKLKQGALSRQLGIPIEKDIPFIVLELIRDRKVGEYINFSPDAYHSMKKIKITKLLKKRAQLALNLKRIKH